jgi:hypothetical protein
MGSYIQGGFGLQRLIDAKERYERGSHPVYLRLREFVEPDTQLWAQMGFSISPSGTAQVGTQDVLITPQPASTMVSLHNIGMSEGKLRFGARMFTVSASFVDAQVITQTLANQDLVWRGNNVLGLVTDNLLFSIEDITHEEWQGKTISWMLTCNSNELR